MAKAVPDSTSPVDTPNSDRISAVDEIVEARERNEQADGEHGAGDRIADGGQRARRLDQLRARLPPRVSEHHGEADRERRRRRGEHEAVQRGFPELRRQTGRHMHERIV